MNFNIFNGYSGRVKRLFWRKAMPEHVKSVDLTEAVEDSHQAHPFPRGENQMERARTQWQVGDWQSLANLSSDSLQHHPDRAKLALLAAAGRLQTGQIDEARQYIRFAKEWGISKKLLTRILAAGVQNSLGRAAAIADDQPRAMKHFQVSIMTGAPCSESGLIAKVRIRHQYQQLGLPLSCKGGALDTVPPAPPFCNTADLRSSCQ